MASRTVTAARPRGAVTGAPWSRRAWGRLSSATGKFALSGLVVVLLVGLTDTFILQQIGRNEAVRDARSVTELFGRSVVEPALEPGIVTGEAAALERLDDVVRADVLGPQVMRVKIWTPSGRIIYSDEERLIGSSYPMQGEDELAFSNESAVAEISDLSRPENRFERSEEKVLEVYYPIHLPDGRPLMFETYMPYSSVAQSGERIWFAFVAPLAGGLIFLWLVQIPLAWSMTRRERKAQFERERLLRSAIESSNLERLRIAADLHDGVVQDLVGISFSVRAMADRIADDAPPEVTASLRDAAELNKQAVRRLRTLLVEIYPPNLQKSGLRAALMDLADPLQARGISTEVEVDEGLDLPAQVEALLFRAAQESLRNVAAHSEARNVRVEVATGEGTARLWVTDDGRGFAASEGEAVEGHFGLKLLDDLARDANGRLDIRSGVGSGTTMYLEVPL
jgi:signal transduction histidine kinase